MAATINSAPQNPPTVPPTIAPVLVVVPPEDADGSVVSSVDIGPEVAVDVRVANDIPDTTEVVETVGFN